jgi:hypothetical protein
MAVPILAFDLPDAEAARARAQELADRTRRAVLVADEVGEVCRVYPKTREQRSVPPTPRDAPRNFRQR